MDGVRNSAGRTLASLGDLSGSDTNKGRDEGAVCGVFGIIEYDSNY